MGIRQLASELQLSIGTVSRALNDRPDVNPETRARVKAAAARAGYVPDQSGRSLRSGRTGIVAAVIPTQGCAPSSRFGALHRAGGRPPHAAPAGARPHRAVPRPRRGSAGEPAAYRAAPDRRRGHHQPDDGRRPAARLPEGRRRRLRRLRPQRRARRLSCSSTSTSRRWRPRRCGSSSATATGGSALALSDHAAQLRDHRLPRCSAPRRGGSGLGPDGGPAPAGARTAG